MKRGAGARRGGSGASRDWDEDGGHGLPSRASEWTPSERAAHHRGTRRSRWALAALVLACALVALLRPLYGPYIDRFGDGGDQSVSRRLGEHFESRAKRHELVLPRSWGHHRHGHDGQGARVAPHRTLWNKAIDALREAPEEERERIIHGLRRRDRRGADAADEGARASRASRR
jgi:hypothetical protein